jgi:Na+(H+)/acetate symporter ActP
MPFIGFFLTIIGYIPIIGEQIENILWSISFFSGYVLVNMVNANNLGKYCNTDFLGRDFMDKFGFFFMLFLTIFIKVFNEVSPI